MSIVQPAGEENARRSADVAPSASSAWENFAAANSVDQFYASWLAILCEQIEQVTSAMLLIEAETQNSYAPAAVWPDPARDMAYLAPAAQRALSERRGVVEAHDGSTPGHAPTGAFVAYPVELDGKVHGAIVLDLAPRPASQLQRALRAIHWGAAWIIDLFRQRELDARQAIVDRLALAADVVACALQEKQFRSAAIAVANELVQRLDCERVCIGAERDGHIRIEAISHTAVFDQKSVLARQIADAMDETLDLGTAIVWPAAGDDALAAAAHAALAGEGNGSAIVSAPLPAAGYNWGVILLERPQERPFDAATVELVRTVGLLIGPVLELRRDNDRGPIRRARDSFGTGLQVLFGPRYPGLKLIGGLAFLVLLLASLLSGEHRVTARTVIEGEVQRAIVTPYDGYVVESLVRAGDVVKTGHLVVRLDDKDLRLEQNKWEAEREQHLRKYRQALAARDRANLNVLGAQVNQAEAQLQLVSERIARSAIVAPFDGIVVSGDLSQLLGTPVEQGKVLFEIAPLNAYRVILKVDERDIAYVKASQQGELVLSGMPGERIPFAVSRITPVTTPEDGHNYFRVEARVAHASERLRPGMEGVSKITAGEARLVWIWTHKLVDWLRLALWTWLP